MPGEVVLFSVGVGVGQCLIPQTCRVSLTLDYKDHSTKHRD